jgi:multicomponent Na+:H+ antiporter subunit F
MGVVCIVLLLSMIAGLWRAGRGPSLADRLIGIQMSGTTAIAFLLTLAEWRQVAAMRDVALVLALLAAAFAMALVQVVRDSGERNE